MKIELHHQNVSTINVEEMTKFYRDIIGLKESEEIGGKRIKDQYSADVSFLLDDSGKQVHVAKKDPYNGFSTGEHVNPLLTGHIAFRVDDIEELKRRLKDNNIMFSDIGEWSIKGWYQVFVHDPDGNVIEFQQVLDK